MSSKKTKNTRGSFSAGQLKLPFLFWLGMLSFALFLWAVNSFMVYQNQGRITQSAEVSVTSFASFVSDYVEKHKVLVKSVAHHHQDRILSLAGGGGYPYDFHEIETEIQALFPKGTEFAIVDRHGDPKLGTHVDQIGPKCRALMKQSMRQMPASVITVKSHISPIGASHFDILFPIVIGEDYAAIWVKLSFDPLKSFIGSLNIKEYELIIREQAPPHNILIGQQPAHEANVLSFDFIQGDNLAELNASEDTLALAPVKDVPWQVRAIEKAEVLDSFHYKIILATIALFIITFILIALLILITRQFQKEREKLKQDAEHDELFNAGPTVLLEKTSDRNMEVKYASPNAPTLFKQESGEIVGHSYLDWIYPDDVELVREQLLEAYRNHEAKVEMVYRIRNRVNDSWKWIYDYTHIKYNHGAKPEILRGYITSIHAQKTAEKNAIDLIRSVPEAIFVTELNGNIVNMNEAAEQLLGLRKEELGEIGFSEWLDDESLHQYEKAKQRYLTEDGGPETQFGSLDVLSIRNVNGQRFSVEIGFNQIELNGVPLLIQVVRDVTLQVNVQQELSKAKEQAESLARARSRFVATISHEIRTPMNGVLGMADLLSETELTKVQQRYALAIKKSGTTLLQIINEVLDFAKLDEGHVVLARERFNLNQLIHESVHLLSAQADEKELPVYVDYPAGLSDEYMGDEVRVKQLVMNLLSNAIKFTEEGSVRISVAETQQSDEGKSEILIKVVDSGIGIEEANQSRLFDSFTQADDSTSRKFGGTGLGLAISKQLVDLMKGEIGVKSRFGEGSEFWVRLPLDQVDSEAETVSEQNRTLLHDRTAERGLDGKKVLVVEDNEINQSVIEAFLERLGAQVDIAENGLQGIDYWRVNPNKYHLILMDCQMPVMDGFEATQMIRKEEAHMHLESRVPIVALTANVIAEDRHKCSSAGMNEFMTKPIERDLFDEMVTKWAR